MVEMTVETLSAQLAAYLLKRSQCSIRRPCHPPIKSTSRHGAIVYQSEIAPQTSKCIDTDKFLQSVKDKANHTVVLDKATSEKLHKDVQSYRLITVATLVDRMKINGSVAREVLKNLEEEGLIKKVVSHARLVVYSESSYSVAMASIIYIGACTDGDTSTSDWWCRLIGCSDGRKRGGGRCSRMRT